MDKLVSQDIVDQLADLGHCREILQQQSLVIHNLAEEVRTLRMEITNMFTDLGTGQEDA